MKIKIIGGLGIIDFYAKEPSMCGNFVIGSVLDINRNFGGELMVINYY